MWGQKLTDSDELKVTRIKNPFKSAEEKFITAVEAHYAINGTLPTVQLLVNNGAVGSESQALAFYKLPYVQKAFEVLGIKIDHDISILDPKQLAAVQIMFDFNDTRSTAKKLRDLGISGQTWQNWLKDPIFQKFCQDKAENLFTINSHEIDQALFSKARTGQVDAIKLYLQLTGRLQEVTAPKIGNQDSHYFLIRIMEAIQEVLADHPDLLRALGAKIRSISNPFLGEQHTTIIIDKTQPALENSVVVNTMPSNPLRSEVPRA